MADHAVVMPDAVALAVAYLTSHPIVAPLGATVAADLTGFTQGQRWLVVKQSGGNRPLRYRIDAPRLDLSAYAETKPNAHTLAEHALAALLVMHLHTFENAVVTAAETVTDPADLTDPLDNNPRFVASVQMWLHPRTPLV